MKFYDLEISSDDTVITLCQSSCGNDNESVIMPPDQAIIVGREIIRIAKDLKRYQAKERDNG